MELKEMMLKRESCRNYDPDRRPCREQLEEIIDVARLSPSACNSQPWRFYVVNNEEISPKLAECMQGMGMNKFTSDCPAFIVVCEEAAKLSRRVSERYARQYFAQIDIGIVTHALCLAATEKGLSTCILGWMNEESIKELLSIGEDSKVRVVLSVGYAATADIREKNRKNTEEIMEYIG